MKKLVLIPILLLLSGNISGNTRSGNEIVATAGALFQLEYDYVNKVSVGTDNYLLINVWKDGSENFTVDHRGACSNPWFGKSAFPLTDPRTQAWERIALASLMGRIKVVVTTDGCTADGRLKLVELILMR